MDHRHGGSRFRIWLLAFTSLAREMASELWPVDYSDHVFKQDVITMHVQ